VIAFDGERPLVLDQDVVAVQLRKGWNLLLCKVGNGVKEWSLTARLTTLAGGPIEGLTYHSDRRSIEQAALALPAKAEAGTPNAAPHLGAVDYYEKRIRLNAKDHRSAYRLGWLLLNRFALGLKSQRPRELLLTATKGDPKAGHYQLTLAEAARDLTASAPDRDENLRREVLVKASRNADVSIRARIALAEYYLYTMQNLDRARRQGTAVEKSNPLSLRTQILLYDLCNLLGWEGQARRRLKAVYRRSPSFPGVLLRAGGEAYREGRMAESLTHYRRLLRLDNTVPGARNGVINACLRMGDEALLAKTLDSLLAVRPYDASLIQERADQQARMGQPDRALVLLESALNEAPSQSHLLAKQGDILMQMGKRQAAILSYREALALTPTLVKLRRYLDFLEGTRDELGSPRGDLRSLVEQHRDYAVPPGTSRLFLLSETASRINGDGTRSQLQHYVVKVLSREAARELSSIPITYESSRETARVLSARVLRAGGKLEKARVSDFSGRERVDFKFLRFSPLQIGDVVEVMYRKDEFRQGFFGDYFGEICFFHRDYPVITSRYLLEHPADRKVYLHTLGGVGEPEQIATEEKDRVRLRWVMKDLPGLEDERLMPSRQELSAQVQVSTFADWSELTHWYSHLIKDQIVSTPEIRRQVRLLTLGMGSRVEKLDAIYRWVSTEIRNEGWEFGVHGYKPYSTDVIFRRRFGDCKDKAILVNVMAGEVGLDAWPVLIRATEDRGSVLGRSREDLSLPILNHFNHCISAVQVGETVHYLDPTIPHHSLSRLPAQNLDARVVEVREGEAVQTRLAAGKAAANGWEDETEMVLNGDGSAGIEQRVQVRGEAAAFFRTYFGRSRDREVVEYLTAKRWGRASVERAEIEANDDPLDDRVSLSAKIGVEGVATPSENRIRFSLPGEWVRGKRQSGAPLPGSLSSMAVTSARSYDLILPATFSLKRRWRIAFPGGYRPAFLPEPVEEAYSFGVLRFQCVLENDLLVVTRTLSVDRTRILRKEYEAFRRFTHLADEVDGMEFVLEKRP
jgi:tetratricopeptide (TPR) repeat protein